MPKSIITKPRSAAVLIVAMMVGLLGFAPADAGTAVKNLGVNSTVSAVARASSFSADVHPTVGQSVSSNGGKLYARWNSSAGDPMTLQRQWKGTWKQVATLQSGTSVQLSLPDMALNTSACMHVVGFSRIGDFSFGYWRVYRLGIDRKLSGTDKPSAAPKSYFVAGSVTDGLYGELDVVSNTQLYLDNPRSFMRSQTQMPSEDSFVASEFPDAGKTTTIRTDKSDLFVYTYKKDGCPRASNWDVVAGDMNRE